jgi:hypothetical protein
LLGATIEGQLALNGAQLTSSDENGNALHADGLRVTSGVYLIDGFSAAGSVRLHGATIGGQLALRGAQLAGSFEGDRMRVDGSVALGDGLSATGPVRLLGATIGAS